MVACLSGSTPVVRLMRDDVWIQPTMHCFGLQMKHLVAIMCHTAFADDKDTLMFGVLCLNTVPEHNKNEHCQTNRVPVG